MGFEPDIRHDENEIRRRVIAALRCTPGNAHIGASVRREVVTLHGRVASLETGQAAEEIVAGLPGVSAVVNELELDAVSWIEPLVEHILVPVDLSDERVGVLRYARVMAERLGSRITVFYADPLRARPGEEAPYAKRLHRTLELYAQPHLDPCPFDTAFAAGEPAAGILEQAQRDRSGLIVMGTSVRDAEGHPPPESVGMAVVRRSRCPVLTVDANDYPPVQRGVGVTAIVCPVNLTATARPAVELAAKLAEVFRAHLFVVRVIEPGEETGVVHEQGRLRTWLGDRLPGTGRHLSGVRPRRREVVNGDAAAATLDAVARFDADLLVVGARARSGDDGSPAVGATTERLLRAASVPVLIVPDGEAVPAAGPSMAG